jgi:beta-xylosidase
MSDEGRRTKDEGPRTKDERQKRWPLVVGLWALVFALAACGGNQQATQPTAGELTPAPMAAQPASTAGPTPIPTPGPNEFANPVINRNFPDPDVLKVGDTYYAYATESDGITVQTAKSTDLINWDLLDNALIVLPPWVKPGFNWAPEVTLLADGKTLVMYFTARDAASDKPCIGVATSDKPEGPFAFVGDRPLICQVDLDGDIDASSFVDDDGTRYVLWKNDGNCCGKDTWLHMQQVSVDGLTLQGEPTRLLKQDQPWEGNLIEAPTLWKHGGKYYLFYSANSYLGPDYAVGYAVAEQPLGPYQKAANPLLQTNGGRGIVIGPGGQDVVVAPSGKTWMIYHSWDNQHVYRAMNIDELDWEGDTPVVKGPDEGPQPRP